MSNNNWQPRRSTTTAKYLKIQERYKYLYDVKRLRHDDVIKKLKEEFFISQDSTIFRIITTDIRQTDDRIQQIPFPD